MTMQTPGHFPDHDPADQPQTDQPQTDQPQTGLPGDAGDDHLAGARAVGQAQGNGPEQAEPEPDAAEQAEPEPDAAAGRGGFGDPQA